MADETITVEAKLDDKGFAATLQRMANRIQKFGNSPTLKSLSNIGASVSGVGAAYKIVTDSIKAMDAAIKDLQESYRTQAAAEIQLTQAAKNNPYLLSSSVRELKNYASELQSISTYGDEQLLPMMAQLASSGRTQAEIMDIMSASMDIAASGVMSLESATKYLNSSFSGLTGELGERIPQVKTLTSEELKQGKAVELVANQYKGMSREVTKATGTSQQLKNAVGDLKEELGAPFEKALSPVRAFFTELIGGWASAKKAKREYEESSQKIKSGKADSNDYVRKIEKEEQELGRLIETLKAYRGALEDSSTEDAKAILDAIPGSLEDAKAAVEKMAEMTQSMIEKQQAYIEKLKAGKARLDEEEQAAKAAAKAEKEKAEAQAKENELLASRDKLRTAYDETLRQKQEEINQRRINGEEISAEAEAQEMYNTALSAYIKMMSDPAFKGNSGNYEHEANARKDIANWGQIAGGADAIGQMKEFENELQRAADEANGIVQNQYDALLDTLDAEYKAVIENKYLEEEEKLRIEELYAQKRKEIVAARNNADMASIDERLNAMSAKNETYWTKYQQRSQEVADIKAEIEAERADREKAINEDTSMNAAEKSEAIAQMNAEMNERIRQADEAMAQAKKDLWSGIASDVQNYTDQAVSIMQDASNLMLDTVKNHATAEQAELELKYRKGEISEEEYNEKLTESKKKAAKEQYKIQMFQWSASILQATANIAQGVTQAIAQGGVAGLITGAIVGAAGAVQIASIIASKPVPPSFATGGIVPGNSYSGDRVQANVNSGEMILNAAQQRSLWETANGRGAGGGMSVVINNSASNVVRAQPQITKDQIEILIDARVNESLKNGRYDSSLNMAQQGMGGDYYGI